MAAARLAYVIISRVHRHRDLSCDIGLHCRWPWANQTIHNDLSDYSLFSSSFERKCEKSQLELCLPVNYVMVVALGKFKFMGRASPSRRGAAAVDPWQAVASASRPFSSQIQKITFTSHSTAFSFFCHFIFIFHHITYHFTNSQ